MLQTELPRLRQTHLQQFLGCVGEAMPHHSHGRSRGLDAPSSSSSSSHAVLQALAGPLQLPAQEGSKSHSRALGRPPLLSSPQKRPFLSSRGSKRGRGGCKGGEEEEEGLAAALLGGVENVPRQPSSKNQKQRGATAGAGTGLGLGSPKARDILKDLPYCCDVLYEQFDATATTTATTTAATTATAVRNARRGGRGQGLGRGATRITKTTAEYIDY